MEKFLVVLNDPLTKQQLIPALAEQGYRVFFSDDEQEMTRAVETESYDFILVDLNALSGRYASVFKKAKKIMPKVLGIMVGDEAQLQTVRLQQPYQDVALLKKPFLVCELLFCIARLRRFRNLQDEASSLKAAAEPGLL